MGLEIAKDETFVRFRSFAAVCYCYVFFYVDATLRTVTRDIRNSGTLVRKDKQRVFVKIFSGASGKILLEKQVNT